MQTGDDKWSDRLTDRKADERTQTSFYTVTWQTAEQKEKGESLHMKLTYKIGHWRW
jgi:hypothetical protein